MKARLKYLDFLLRTIKPWKILSTETRYDIYLKRSFPLP